LRWPGWRGWRHGVPVSKDLQSMLLSGNLTVNHNDTVGYTRAGDVGRGAQYGQPNAAADAGTLDFRPYLKQRS
jgi:hypothetical protein